MPIDPSIALSVKGLELQDPLAQYGRMAAIQQAQNQNALAQYQLGAAQRAEAKDIARTNALAQAGGDETAIANALLKAGDLAGYTSFLKSSREANKANVDLIDAKLKQSRGFLETLDPNAPGAAEAYIAWHEANHKDPVLGPVLAARGITAEQSRERIVQALQTPGGLAQLINQSKLGAEKFMEMNKAQLSTKDIGGAVVDRTFEPLTGKVTEISRVAKTMTPSEVMADARKQETIALEQRRVELAEKEASRKEAGLAEPISKQEIQKREAKYPQAKSAVNGFEAESNNMIKKLQQLKEHKGLEGILGTVYGRTPSLTKESQAAQALYDQVMAKGKFQELQNMRLASPTGGALGNVSNMEIQSLGQAFGALSRIQGKESFQAAIDDVIKQIQSSKERTREAFEETYQYKQGKTVAPAMPASPAVGGAKFLGFE